MATVVGWRGERASEGVTRYSGLVVRISAGIGYAGLRRDNPRGRDRISGLSGMLALDLGGALSDRVVAFGRLAGTAHNHVARRDSSNAGNGYFALIGGGVRYHWLPYDWYASGALGIALVSVTDDLGNGSNARPGLGFEVELGKNWWAGTPLESRTVGLGLRLSFVHCESAGSEGEGPWSGPSALLVLSTTLL